MPVIPSTYRPRFPLRYHHVNTIYPNLFRNVPVDYDRKRIDTPDGDFIDLDFSRTGSKVGVIVVHGLEGSSDSVYMRGLVRTLNGAGWDAITLNLRGCSGVPNLLPSAYHSGATDDLHTVVEHVVNEEDYEVLFIVGFSLGGNITLKYMGERGADLHPKIRSAIGVSVPVELEATSKHLSKMFNLVYLQRFLYSLRGKTKYKMTRFPDAPYDWEKLLRVKNFEEFDNIYTGPAHGFHNGKDYYDQCSSRQFLPSIEVPTLLISAQDDPFLHESCYPFPEAEANQHFFFEAPEKGGHVGFSSKTGEVGDLWLDRRVVEFLSGYLPPELRP